MTDTKMLKLIDQLAEVKTELLLPHPSITNAIAQLDLFATNFGTYLSERQEKAGPDPKNEEAKELMERVGICRGFIEATQRNVGVEIHFPDMVALNSVAYRKLKDSQCQGHPRG